MCGPTVYSGQAAGLRAEKRQAQSLRLRPQQQKSQELGCTDPAFLHLTGSITRVSVSQTVMHIALQLNQTLGSFGGKFG